MLDSHVKLGFTAAAVPDAARPLDFEHSLSMLVLDLEVRFDEAAAVKKKGRSSDLSILRPKWCCGVSATLSSDHPDLGHPDLSLSQKSISELPKPKSNTDITDNRGSKLTRSWQLFSTIPRLKVDCIDLWFHLGLSKSAFTVNPHSICAFYAED